VVVPSTSRGQRTRQKLLDAAEAIFGERGYERASITEITQRAGVAQGTFYVYFPDKQTIFEELVRGLSQRLRRATTEATQGLTNRNDIERAGFRAFFDFIGRHRGLYRIVRQAEFVDEALFRWYYERFAEGYAAGLKAAMDAGQIREMDPEVMAYCIMGMGDFLGMRWVLWQDESLPDAVFEQAFEFMSHGFTPNPT
jgi:AcrR family transcriptional regulator